MYLFGKITSILISTATKEYLTLEKYNKILKNLMCRKILIGNNFLTIQGRVKKISKIFWQPPPPEIAMHC